MVTQSIDYLLANMQCELETFNMLQKTGQLKADQQLFTEVMNTLFLAHASVTKSFEEYVKRTNTSNFKRGSLDEFIG